jgi:hypothetical protein
MSRMLSCATRLPNPPAGGGPSQSILVLLRIPLPESRRNSNKPEFGIPQGGPRISHVISVGTGSSPKAPMDAPS